MGTKKALFYTTKIAGAPEARPAGSLSGVMEKNKKDLANRK
jgi:hypothetical protein